MISVAERPRELRNSGKDSSRHVNACRKVKRAVNLTSGWNDIMKIKRKPDFLLLLAIIVGVGVIITMRVQAGADAHSVKGAASSGVAVVQTR